MTIAVAAKTFCKSLQEEGFRDFMLSFTCSGSYGGEKEVKDESIL